MDQFKDAIYHLYEGVKSGQKGGTFTIQWVDANAILNRLFEVEPQLRQELTQTKKVEQPTSVA